MDLANPYKRQTLRHALSSGGRELLAELLRCRSLLAFDFDGTLAPITAEPDAAMLPASTAALLKKLASHIPCVIVSGRARENVLARLEGIPIAQAVGNHGSQPWLDLEPLRAQVRRWLPIIGERLSSMPGILIEDKGCSLAIHYRHTPARHEALATILTVISPLSIGRVLHGKYVLNLLPAGALHKGEGLGRAMTALKRTRALYVGDDETDEDVFRLPPSAGVLGIRVDYRTSSRASLYLYGQPEIDALLGYLLAGLA